MKQAAPEKGGSRWTANFARSAPRVQRFPTDQRGTMQVLESLWRARRRARLGLVFCET